MTIKTRGALRIAEDGSLLSVSVCRNCTRPLDNDGDCLPCEKAGAEAKDSESGGRDPDGTVRE